jgi:hypothetical protein
MRKQNSVVGRCASVESSFLTNLTAPILSTPQFRQRLPVKIRFFDLVDYFRENIQLLNFKFAIVDFDFDFSETFCFKFPEMRTAVLGILFWGK